MKTHLYFALSLPPVCLPFLSSHQPSKLIKQHHNHLLIAIYWVSLLCGDRKHFGYEAIIFYTHYPS